MSHILRRLPLSRLLLTCGLVLALGVSATAIAFALGTAATPPAKPLAQAVHDALAAPPVEGVSASVKLTDHLIEGADLAGGSGGAARELASNPLITGASGRLWIAKDGRVRLELQAEKGDTQILYDGHAVTLYDASSNTLYRYVIPPKQSGSATTGSRDAAPGDHREAPSVAKIEEAISHLGSHAEVSGAIPTNIAGQPAYTARISPKETGSLLAGAEVSWDALHGVPLRFALYSTSSSSAVIELAASSISYGPVESSVFELGVPPGAKVQEIKPADHVGAKGSGSSAGEGSHPKLSTHGSGLTTIAVIESPAQQGSQKAPSALSEASKKVSINGISANELPSALGTLLSFERAGVRYVLAGAVPPATIEAVAKGL